MKSLQTWNVLLIVAKNIQIILHGSAFSPFSENVSFRFSSRHFTVQNFT